MEVRSLYNFISCVYRIYGWQHHHLLDAFQRDHAKRAYALTQGYVVFDVTNKMILESPNLVIEQIKQVISHRDYYDDDIVRVGSSYCKIIKKSKDV